MGAQGTATLNFGGFPGGNDASVLVTGQTGIAASSLVEAWLIPVDTGDHSADEHLMVGPRVFAGNIDVANAQFTIYGIAQPRTPEPDLFYLPKRPFRDNYRERGRAAPATYGQWSVAWVWN